MHTAQPFSEVAWYGTGEMADKDLHCWAQPSGFCPRALDGRWCTSSRANSRVFLTNACTFTAH